MSKIACHHLWKIFGSQAKAVQKSLLTNPNAPIKTGHVVAVKDVSFEVGAGEIFVVMGLSGSGKSTLVRCLSRLIEPTAGKIIVNDADVTEMNKKQLRHLRLHQMSMVFQKFGLFPHRRVIHNIAYGLEVQGVKKKARLQRAEEMLELVGLQGWAQHYPHELSGGMQQRVGLARALAVNPEILLCDEPFSALDPLIRREMQDELLRLQTLMNKTIVFITHDFSEAVRLGHAIAIMKDGEIVQMDTPERILLAPANAYVHEFTRDIPRLKVLTAQSIMKPYTNGVSLERMIPATTSVEEIIPMILADSTPILVVTQEQQPIGVVDQSAIRQVMEAENAK